MTNNQCQITKGRKKEDRIQNTGDRIQKIQFLPEAYPAKGGKELKVGN